MNADHTYERLVLSILVPIVVARACYLTVEDSAQEWLHSLKNIPEWANGKDLFNIAWITTYAASGLASYLIFNASADKAVTQNPALISYAGQLGLCWLYTIVIYGVQSYDLGLAVLLLCDAMALITSISFFKVSLAAAVLNIPINVWLLTVTALLLHCRSTVTAALGDKMKIME